MKTGVAAGALSFARGAKLKNGPDEKASLSQRVLRTEFFKQPVRIAAVDLLKNGKHFLVRVRSHDGVVGLSDAHRRGIESAYPVLINRVAPFFSGKDARELESLIEGVYLHESNYKWQGLAFWVSVASVELAILDMLGKIAGKPVGELLGGVIRRQVAVYRASEKRSNSADEEIDYLQKLVSQTGARAIKFRLGGRMYYDDSTTRRDLALIEKTRKTFGDAMTIYADANGSYDALMAIRIGRAMEEHKLGFLEEPVPFDHYDETRAVADTLTIPVAGGECESSLRRFRWLIENRAVQIAQPDLFYFGGMIRSIKVARMAAAAGIDCTPHISGYGLGYLHALHFASCVSNAGKFQEYKGNDGFPVSSDTSSLRSERGIIRIPEGAGLGVTIDPDFIRKAELVSA